MTAHTAEIALESLEYRSDGDVYEAAFDPTTTTPSMAVVATLSEVQDVDPIDVEPLYDTIDPDALDALLDGSATEMRDVEFTFSRNGYSITVASDGVVTVESSDHSLNSRRPGPDGDLSRESGRTDSRSFCSTRETSK